MLQKQITPAYADAEIRLLYETAFPQEEQIPWDDLVRLIDEMHLDFTAYYDDDKLWMPRDWYLSSHTVNFCKFVSCN